MWDVMAVTLKKAELSNNKKVVWSTTGRQQDSEVMSMRLLSYALVTAFAAALLFDALVWAQDDAPFIVLEDVQGNVGQSISMDLVLVSAPEGLQQYSFVVTVANSTVASMALNAEGVAQVEGVELSGQLFQVSASSATSASFRALDLNNDIRAGDENLVLARITLLGVAPGSTEVQLRVDAFVDDRGVKLEPQVQNGVVQVGQASGQPPDTPQNPPVDETTSPRILPGGGGQPQDLDGDGLYEDVNGDGVLNNDDVLLLLNNLNNASVQEDRAFFDFNQDGVLDNQDVNTLLSLATPTSTSNPPPGTTGEAPSLQLSSARVNVEETASVDLILSNAPQGLERYDVVATVAPAGVARFVGVSGVAIPNSFVQVVSLTDTQIRFRAADLSDLVRPGAQNVVLARLQLQGLGAGTVNINLSFELFTNESSEPMTPSVQGGSVEFFQGPSAVEAGLNAPKDLDGDGLFEDVNGDGVFNNEDAVLFAFHLNNPVVVNNVAFFDFNDDGQISFADATALSQMASAAS